MASKLEDAAPGAGYVASVLIGGTTSKIAGGKFASGAITAVMVFGLNEQISSRKYGPGIKKERKTGSAALRLIRKHRGTITNAARSQDVEAQHIASIIFQEKMHGILANGKNAGAWMLIEAGRNDATVGLAEMDINTAARLLDVDVNTMDDTLRNQIIDTLADDHKAIHLIAMNIKSFETALGRDVTLKEATFGHNAGINNLISDLPIVRGSEISRRSWNHQDNISEALRK